MASESEKNWTVTNLILQNVQFDLRVCTKTNHLILIALFW